MKKITVIWMVCSGLTSILGVVLACVIMSGVFGFNPFSSLMNISSANKAFESEAEEKKAEIESEQAEIKANSSYVESMATETFQSILDGTASVPEYPTHDASEIDWEGMKSSLDKLMGE